MNNAELIDGLRCCAESTNIIERCDIADCPYHSHSWACIDDMLRDAADALEAAEAWEKAWTQKCERLEKRIAELEAQNELKDGTITAMATGIGKLQAAVDNYEKLIAELSAQIQKWVSAEVHLPEESGEYIVYIQMGTGVEVPDFFGSDDLSYVTSMYFKERQKLWLDEYDEAYNADLSLVDTVNDYHVTHWMPLPQKPKGEKERR